MSHFMPRSKRRKLRAPVRVREAMLKVEGANGIQWKCKRGNCKQNQDRCLQRKEGGFQPL